MIMAYVAASYLQCVTRLFFHLPLTQKVGPDHFVVSLCVAVKLHELTFCLIVFYQIFLWWLVIKRYVINPLCAQKRMNLIDITLDSKSVTVPLFIYQIYFSVDVIVAIFIFVFRFFFIFIVLICWPFLLISFRNCEFCNNLLVFLPHFY